MDKTSQPLASNAWDKGRVKPQQMSKKMWQFDIPEEISEASVCDAFEDGTEIGT